MGDRSVAPRYGGRVALVTGAGSGIGAATADRLAAEGAHVVMVDLDADHLRAEEEAVGKAAAHGGGAEAVILDVADASGWDRLAEDVTRRHGRLDLLHSNAAIAIVEPATRLSVADWERQIAVDYGPAVRVNSVIPGPIMSPAWDDVSGPDRERSVRQTVLARFGRPEEVAAAVAFLGSAEASYITGASLVVDGGWSVTADSA